jgi:serine protease Do
MLKGWRQLIITIVLSAVFGAAAAVATVSVIDDSPENQPGDHTAVRASTSSKPAGSITEVVAMASPSVVSIVVSKNIPQYERYLREGPFGLQIPERRQSGSERKQVGSGSGFFVSNRLLVTNRHVVSDREAQYEAVTAEGERLNLEVVGRDQFLDIAILRTEEKHDFPTLEFGDSSQLQPGQKVVAIGNALGEFRNSVSTGVISGLSRSVVAGRRGRPERLERVLQTDAAINPGNSGGPLLNTAGEVIGVNVAIVRGSENISFALPATAVKRVVESVKETGRIIRPFLGIRYTPLTEEIISARDLTVEEGVLVVGGPNSPAVMPDSAAAEAGIRAGDVITNIGDTKITGDIQIGSIIRGYAVGDTVLITLVRKGKTLEVQADLQPAPDLVRQ